MAEPKACFPQFIATADPSAIAGVDEAKTGTPAMTLTREMYAVVTGGGGVIAAVQPVGDEVANATLGLVTSSCVHWNDGAGTFVVPTLTIMDGEAGPLSGNPEGIQTYALIAGVAPTVELRAAQMHHANGGDFATSVLQDDLGGLLGCASVPYLYDGLTGFQSRRGTTEFRSVVATAAGETVVWTPAAGNVFRLMGYTISVAGTLAAADVQTIQLLDGTGGSVIAQHLAVVTDALAGDTQITASLDNGYLSGQADNDLVIDLSDAMTAGGVAINVWGVEEVGPI